MTSSILIVEPHPDDAFLCLHSTIGAWKEEGYEVSLLTVFANAARTKEAAAYAESISVDFSCLGGEEASMTGESKPRLVGSLLRRLKEVGDNYGWIACPLGLQHPDHVSVRRTVDRYSEERAWYYLDSPYQTKQKNNEELNEAISGMRIRSLRYPGKRKWYSKEIFKSQSRFFHYNPFQDWKLAELVVSPSWEE